MLCFKAPDVAIRVRPWKNGAFLYFPFDYHRGGVGVIIPEDKVKRYQLMQWSPINFLVIPFAIVFALCLALLPKADWVYALGAGAGSIAAYGFWRYKMHLYATILASYPLAPITLSAQRYWQEYASQQSWTRILFDLLFWSVFIVSLIMSTILDPLSLFEKPLRGLLFAAGYAYAFIHGRSSVLRFSHKLAAIKAGVSAGTPLHADTVAANADTPENLPHPHPPHQAG